VNSYLLHRNDRLYNKTVSKDKYSQNYCATLFLKSFKKDLKVKGVDIDLLTNSIDKRYTYEGTMRKNMRRVIHYLVVSEYQEDDINYINMLRHFFKSNWKKLEANELWSDEDDSA